MRQSQYYNQLGMGYASSPTYDNNFEVERNLFVSHYNDNMRLSIRERVVNEYLML